MPENRRGRGSRPRSYGSDGRPDPYVPRYVPDDDDDGDYVSSAALRSRLSRFGGPRSPFDGLFMHGIDNTPTPQMQDPRVVASVYERDIDYMNGDDYLQNGQDGVDWRDTWERSASSPGNNASISRPVSQDFQFDLASAVRRVAANLRRFGDDPAQVPFGTPVGWLDQGRDRRDYRMPRY